MRRRYLDNIRWATVVLVVLYHVLYMYNAEGVAGGIGNITGLSIQIYDLYLYAVFPWFMSILFIVSGICSKLSLDRYSTREFIARRTRKLLVPSTIGLLTFQFIQGYVSMSLLDVWRHVSDVPGIVKFLIMAVSGIGVLWFVQTLWLFTIVLTLIRKIEKNRLWKICDRINAPTLCLMAIPLWGAAQILNMPVVVVYRFGLYATLFLLGYFVFSHERVVDVTKKWFPLFLVFAVAAGIAFCAKNFGKNYADAPVNRSPLFVGYCWFACLAILGGMAKYGDFENAFTRWMNRRSFGLYVFHCLGISSIALWVAKPGLAPPACVYLLSLIAGFAAGYLLNALIARTPFFRQTVLGFQWGNNNDASRQSGLSSEPEGHDAGKPRC